MSRPRLLMLGGADIQVTAIQKAVELGYEVITCDYLPNNPGHAFAHAYHNVSTTDLQAVLALARDLKITGISAYASDPAAVTAAYVSERLGLPGNAYLATCTIQDKVTFRSLQADLGVPAPRAALATGGAQVRGLVGGWPHGGVIKPVDTSGSKGIHRVPRDVDAATAEALYNDALSFSRAKRVIIEEYLPRTSVQMTGDALIHDGRVRFWCFGDVHFNDAINGLVPRGVTLPGSIAKEQVDRAMRDVQRVVDRCGLRQGVFNIDLFIDEQDRPVVVDIGARNGGNMLNTLYHLSTGVDLMELSLRQCMGERIDVPAGRDPGRHVGHIVVHSRWSGILRGIRLSDTLERHVFYRSFNVKPGDRVGRFINSGHRLGLLLVEFPDHTSMLEVYDHIYDHMLLDVVPDEGGGT